MENVLKQLSFHTEIQAGAFVKIKLCKGISVPDYATIGSSGFDIAANLEQPVTLYPGERKAIATGIMMEIPKEYEVQIRSRSGLALKSGVIVLNAPGTIDSDYRGEIKVILMNLDAEPYTIKHGDRIAQGVLAKVERAFFVRADGIECTKRGEGGFGSTGI